MQKVITKENFLADTISYLIKEPQAYGSRDNKNCKS